jgi:uncharacterized membrane protein
MYKIIGADGKEYGPVNTELLRQWIAEGRLNAQSRVQPEGSPDWKTVGELPEFADLFRTAQPGPAPFPGPTADPTAAQPIFEGDYELDIAGCISRGWQLLQGNMGTLLGGLLIYFGIELVIGLFGAIPIIGPLFSLANLFVAGPLMGGLFYLFLKALRNQPASAGDVFAGFQKAFGQLILGVLVPGLLVFLSVIPAVILGAITLLPSLLHHQKPAAPQILIFAAVLLVCMIPAVFLQVNWRFTLALIIDKRLDFWSAMGASWRRVMKHWWQVFGLIIVVGLLNFAGVLLCCIGLLFTFPVGIGAMMCAYETIFNPPRTPAA